MHTTPLLAPAIWARDFALLGLAVGVLAPLFVVLDPGFALLAGLAGCLSGAAVGGSAAILLERLRGRVPLAVLLPGLALAGALWGGLAGSFGGLGSLWFGPEAIPMGFVLGATTGMVTLGLGALPYCMLSARGGSTLPLVAVGAVLAPALGWAGLVALVASLFGLWLLALPAMASLGVAIDRSERRVKASTGLALDRERLARRLAQVRAEAA